jgi:hypothetical protein
MMCADAASCGSIVRSERIHVRGVWREKICKSDLETVSNVHAQGDRAGAFAGTQLNVTGNQTFRWVNSDDIALQRIDHTRGVDYAETVIDQGLVQCDHVSLNRPFTRRRRGLSMRSRRRDQHKRCGGAERLPLPQSVSDIHIFSPQEKGKLCIEFVRARRADHSNRVARLHRRFICELWPVQM